MRIKVYDLTDRMHASIGSAGTNRFNRFGRKTSQGFFQGILNSVAVWLGLPATPIRPVVGEA